MTQRIYRTNQKIEVKIDDISIFISPLSYHAKMEMQGPMVKAAQGDMASAMTAVAMGIKRAVKDIKGFEVEDENGEFVPYQLKFEDSGELTDECVSDLLNLPISNKISTVCTAFLSGVPDKIVDGEGKPLEGVVVCSNKAKVPARKK